MGEALVTSVDNTLILMYIIYANYSEKRKYEKLFSHEYM